MYFERNKVLPTKDLYEQNLEDKVLRETSLSMVQLFDALMFDPVVVDNTSKQKRVENVLRNKAQLIERSGTRDGIKPAWLPDLTILSKFDLIKSPTVAARFSGALLLPFVDRHIISIRELDKLFKESVLPTTPQQGALESYAYLNQVVATVYTLLDSVDVFETVNEMIRSQYPNWLSVVTTTVRGVASDRTLEIVSGSKHR